MRRMGDQKQHRDVFRGEEPAEPFVFVGRAAVEDQHCPFVEGSQPPPESLPRRLDVRDEDVCQPLDENNTRDEAIFRSEHGDVFWVVPRLKNKRVERLAFCDDCRLHSRAVKCDAGNQRASVRRPGDTNFHPIMVFHSTRKEHVDALAVGIPLSPHFVHVVDEGGVNTFDSSWERRCVERPQRGPVNFHSRLFRWQRRYVSEAMVPHELEQDRPLDKDVVLVREVLEQDPHCDRVIFA